ncbi:MAG: hypothetical protein KUG77_06410 [Nannocystaceae bacterium]|nr:hypothetical protein [Nannocystaceae bacterium]
MNGLRQRCNSFARRARGSILVGVLAAATLLVPSVADASPRDDLVNAYLNAFDQLDNVDLEGALVTLDSAIADGLSAGLAGDPSLAKMYAMRAGIVFSISQDRGQALQSCLDAVALDYNIKLPIELASEELSAICDEARAGVQPPSNDVVHTPPVGTPNADIEFVAVANAAMPLGSTLVMYWRPVGSDAEFAGETMVGEDNWGVWTIPVASHGGKDLEYFFYGFDPTNQPLVSRGDKANPLVLKMDQNAAIAPVGGEGGEKADEDGGGEAGDDTKKKRSPNGKSGLPRVFINLGFGAGLGIARGTAEQTYEQYTPGIPGAVYGTREQACAVERWYSGQQPLAGNAASFQQHLAELEPLGAVPYTAGDETARGAFVSAYDPNYCSQRHPVSTGFAVAPFHVAPEIGIRVSRAVVVSVYSRLQLVTGSKVFTDDTSLAPATSFNSNVRSSTPQGFQQKPGFTWAIGAKVKYFFGKDERKFRVFAGGFAGYGQARLRVPMNFANDRNGNSVPDLGEVALSGPLNAEGRVEPSTCVAVWPYTQGCTGGAAGETDRSLALAVRGSTATGDERIDTVVIGPAMFGALLGFNYQLHKNFSLFAELNVGGWMPTTTSVLFDLNVGPAITF